MSVQTSPPIGNSLRRPTRRLLVVILACLGWILACLGLIPACLGWGIGENLSAAEDQLSPQAVEFFEKNVMDSWNGFRIGSNAQFLRL